MRTLLLLSILLVAVSGCEHYKTMEDVDCDRITDKGEYDRCVYNKSLAIYNAADCRDISDEKLRSKCIDDVAIALQNFYPCKQHEKKSLEHACERKVGDARKEARR